MTAIPVSSSEKSAIHSVMAPMDHACQNISDSSLTETHLPPKKRVCHGFSLPY
jgi:hypothetical protein